MRSCVTGFFPSLSVVFSQLTQAAAPVGVSLLFMAEECSPVWTDHILHGRSSVDGLFPPFGRCEQSCCEP